MMHVPLFSRGLVRFGIRLCFDRGNLLAVFIEVMLPILFLGFFRDMAIGALGFFIRVHFFIRLDLFDIGPSGSQKK